MVDDLGRGGLAASALNWFGERTSVDLEEFSALCPFRSWKSNRPNGRWFDQLATRLTADSNQAITSRIAEMRGLSGEQEQAHTLLAALREAIRQGASTAGARKAAVVAFTLTSQRINSEEGDFGGDFAIAYYVDHDGSVHERLILCQAKVVSERRTSITTDQRTDLRASCLMMRQLVPDASFGVYFEIDRSHLQADRCEATREARLPSSSARPFAAVLQGLWTFQEGQTIDPATITEHRKVLVVLAST